MGRLVKVNKPIFHLHQPGDDLELSTRDRAVSPLTRAIQDRKQQLFNPANLAITLPEKTPSPAEDEMQRAIEARDLGESKRQGLDDEPAAMDEFLENVLTGVEPEGNPDTGEDIVTPEDITAFKSGHVTPDLIENIKRRMTGYRPQFVNDQDPSKNRLGDPVGPNEIDEFFRRRGY